MSDSREQFEAWYLSAMDDLETFPLEFPGGPYLSQDLDLAWASWQASRQALVVELPQQSGVNRDWNQAIRYCHQAIEAAGVRVKP